MAAIRKLPRRVANEYEMNHALESCMYRWIWVGE